MRSGYEQSLVGTFVDLAQLGHAETEHSPDKVCDTHADEQSHQSISRGKRWRCK